MILTIQNGKPAIVREDGTTVFYSIYTGTRYWGNMYNVLKDYTDQSWTVQECASFSDRKDFSVLGEMVRCFVAECENSRIYAALTEKHCLFRTETRNMGADKEPETVIALGGMYAKRLERAMYNTYTTYNGLKQYDMNDRTHIKRFTENDFCESAVHMPAVDCDGKPMNFGFVSFERYFTGVFACEGGTVEFRHHLDGRKFKEGENLCSDWMMISFYEDMTKELPGYTRFIHDFNYFSDRHTHVPTGFSSWYYYMENINERMVYENLAKIDEIRDRVPLEVFQIDAGWAPGNHNGEPYPELFPKGMKFYADLIREHGMIPGIWLKPFDFCVEDDTVKEHPDWFVKTTEGELALFHNCAMLDVTHPEAKEYVRRLYHKITYDWGYRYLKIDIVSEFMTVGVYHDPEAGALQNVREYFRLVREASHPDTYILGCTCPLFEVAEFVDGMRVAVDIFERWESLMKEFNLIFKRYYMNGNLFISDPDCLMIRKKENEDADCRRYCSRTDDEIRTFLTAIYAAGGGLFLSDKLPLMNEAQIDQYARLFPVDHRVGRPLDLMESYIPGILDLGYQGDVRTVAFINWGERERSFHIELTGAHNATEHWTDEVLGQYDGAYEVTLQPHCSTLVHFERA
ncbi:MAG: alpha-galactosidase [Roseburia sp.]|nr:alpha-galactosidase [Roseburia sp.]